MDNKKGEMKKYLAQHDPFFENTFVVDFKSPDGDIDEKKLHIIGEQVGKIIGNFTKINHVLGKQESVEILFNLNIIDDKIQPLDIIEDIILNDSHLEFDLDLVDRSGNVIRQLAFKQCNIDEIKGFDSFDYTLNGCKLISVVFNCKCKIII